MKEKLAENNTNQKKTVVVGPSVLLSYWTQKQVQTWQSDWNLYKSHLHLKMNHAQNVNQVF